MGPRVSGRACAVVASVLLASLLAPGAVSGPFNVSSAVAVAKVDKVLPDRPLPPGTGQGQPSDPTPTEPDPPPTPELPPAPEPTPEPEPIPTPELPPPSAEEPAPAPAPGQSAPPSSDPAPSGPGTPAPAPSADTPTTSDRTGSSGSSQRGTVLNGGARPGRATSDAGGGDVPAPVIGTNSTSAPAVLGLFPPDRRVRRDDPLAALGLGGWNGAAPGAPAVGDARSGVKGVASSGGGVQASDRSNPPGPDDSSGTLSPFGRDSSGGFLILLGLLLAVALLVRHELPRR